MIGTSETQLYLVLDVRWYGQSTMVMPQMNDFVLQFVEESIKIEAHVCACRLTLGIGFL